MSSRKEKHQGTLFEQPYGTKTTLIGIPEVKEGNAASFRYGEEAAPNLVMVNGNWEEKRRGTSTLAGAQVADCEAAGGGVDL